MAITKILNFGHLVNDVAVGGVETGYGLSLSELTVAVTRHTSQAWAALLVNSGRLCYARLASTSGSYVASAIATIPVANFLGGVDPSKIKRFVLGFKLETVQAPANPFPALGFTLETPVSDATGSAGYASGDPIAYTVSTTTTASTQYLEIVLDLVNKKLETWVDGKLAKTDTVADKYISGFSTLKLFIGNKSTAMFPAGNNSSIIPMAYYDNLYAVVDTGDANDTQSGRLGPIMVERVAITAADGGWTPSTSGTALSVINTATTAAANQTPNLTSPANLTPLDLTLDVSSYNSGKKLLGLSAAVTPFRTPGDVGFVDASWITTDGEKNKTEVTMVTPSSTTATVQPKNAPALNLPAAGAVKLRLTPRGA